jgi:hypothetical protein
VLSLTAISTESCKEFPYTDQPDRLYSLYSVLTAASVCPAAYEILEALKELYNFTDYKHNLRKTPYQKKFGFSFKDDPLFLTSSDGYSHENDTVADDFEELPF